MTSSSETAARCSWADQRSDSLGAWVWAWLWPMRGWLLKASCHASSGKCCQMLSDVSIRKDSSAMGRRLASATAHASEPQQGSASRAAASGSSEFHRARTLFIVLTIASPHVQKASERSCPHGILLLHGGRSLLLLRAVSG